MEKSEIEQRALALPDQVKKLTVQDAKTLERASDAKIYCKDIRKEINAEFDPVIKSTNQAHKEAVALKKKFLAPVIEAETYINGQIASYMAMIAQKRREAEQKERDRQLAAERAEEKRRQRALEAVEAGKTKEAEQILSEPEPDEAIAPLEPPPPSKPKMDGVHLREHWEFEIIDRWKIPATFLMPDMKAIGENVRLNKGDTKIPGIRVFRKDIVV